MRDLRNQFVSVAAIENASNLGALATGILDCFQVDSIGQLVADVVIGETADRVLSAEQGSEYQGLVTSYRIERFGGTFRCDLFAGSDAVQGVNGVGGIAVAEQPGDALAQGSRPTSWFSIATTSPFRPTGSKDIQSVLTIVGGKTAYDAEAK